MWVVRIVKRRATSDVGGVKYDCGYRRFFYRFRGFIRETGIALGLLSSNDMKFLQTPLSHAIVGTSSHIFVSHDIFHEAGTS